MQRIIALSPLFLTVYLALLAWLSLSPAKLYRGLSLPWIPGDTAVHFTLYLVLAVLQFLFLLRFDNKIIRITAVSILMASAIGVSMELLQLWFVLLNRSFEWKDILMNFFGATTGSLLCFAFLRKVKL